MCQSISSCPHPFTFTGKERDEETGYGYFGARYMDHELMTMWLSVDPMADKYPSISPYAYCALNPVKLVDPNGKEFCTPGYELNEKGKLLRIIKDDKCDYFVVRQKNGNRITSQKFQKGTISYEGSYKRVTKEDGTVTVDRYSVKSGMAKDECMQFLANNTDVEWSAFGFSDGTNKLFTSHCRFKEYGGSDFIQIELGPYSLITHCDVSKDNQQANGWSLQMSSKTNSLTMFDHIHPRGGKTMPSESDKRLVADLRIKYPNMAASIILPEKIPLSY